MEIDVHISEQSIVLENEMKERMKILMLCDHPLVPSGVGTQAKYLIEGLLSTNKYKFVVFGGAIKHPDYRPQKVAPDKFGDGNWIIYPVDGYGDKQRLREALVNEKPDAILLFTDPRFFTWVWEMEDEVRQQCPILYWHVWDNDPSPAFNAAYYESTDFVSTLSLKTFGLLQDLEIQKEKFNYIPHAVSPEIFKPLSEQECKQFKVDNFGPHADKSFIAFWNNRNARRKMTGDVIASFAKFAEKVGKRNVALAMHTAVNDPEGQNIIEVAKKFGIDDNLIISESRVLPEVLNGFYNATDCTINIANNEGFGLSTLESMMAGSPIIAQMTGGLQFQLGDWWQDLETFNDQDYLHEVAKRRYSNKTGTWTGIPIFPSTRSCTGSQTVPYIFDDRVSHEDVSKALLKMFEMGRKNRREIGLNASVWARTNFNLDSMIMNWDKTLEKQIEKFKTTKRSNIRSATL